MREKGGREGVALALAILASGLLVLSLRGERLEGVSSTLSWLMAPAERPASFLAEKFRTGYAWVADRADLVAEIQLLRDRNSRLAMERARALGEGMQAEAAQRGEWLVDYRDPSAWWDEVRLEVSGGRAPALSTPALLDGHFVGMVVRSSSHSCSVRLITSASSFIPVVVESTRDLGVLVGDGKGGLWLRYTPPLELPVGSHITTALGAEGLPPGLLVGGLTGERREAEDGLIEYGVSPSADLGRLYSLSLMEVE